MPLQATSLHASTAISGVIKKVLESLNCIAIEIANDGGNTETWFLTMDINSKPIRTKVDAISLQDYFGRCPISFSTLNSEERDYSRLEGIL